MIMRKTSITLMTDYLAGVVLAVGAVATMMMNMNRYDVKEIR